MGIFVTVQHGDGPTTSWPEPGRLSPNRMERNTLRNCTELDPSGRIESELQGAEPQTLLIITEPDLHSFSGAGQTESMLDGVGHAAEPYGAGPCWAGAGRTEPKSERCLQALQINTEPDSQRLGRSRAGAQADNAETLLNHMEPDPVGPERRSRTDRARVGRSGAPERCGSARCLPYNG
jgi:hypothetical protein